MRLPLRILGSILLATIISCGTSVVEPDEAIVYFCPMHPDFTSLAPGSCEKCGMDLIPGDPLASREYTVELETVPKAVAAGESVELRFKIFHPETDSQVTDFAIVHDKPYHLFVVSQTMKHFFHIHPEPQEDGTLVVGGGEGDSPDLVLPEPGYYKVYSDFLPIGGTPQVIAQPLITKGFSGDLYSSLAKLEPDASLSKTAGGMAVELTLEPAELIAGQFGELHYRLTDVESGQPVADLQPYLGAWGHTLILSEDMIEHIHTHPAEELPPQMGQMGETEQIGEGGRSSLFGGPDVTFEAFIPKAGTYRIWTQFLRNDRLTTLSFDVRAYRLGEEPSRTGSASRGSAR